MKKSLILLLLFATCLCFQAQAQQDLSSRWPKPKPNGAKRTYPIDSCLYFQLPIDFFVTRVQTVSPSQDEVGVTVRFQSSDPSGPMFRGTGRILVDTLQAFYQNSHQGKGILILPESAFSSSSGGNNNLVFPMPANGFIFEIHGFRPDPPIQITMFLRDMEIEL